MANSMCMVHGAWCMVHGAWYMVHGAWCMVHGAWYNGLWFLHAHSDTAEMQGVVAYNVGACM